MKDTNLEDKKGKNIIYFPSSNLKVDTKVYNSKIFRDVLYRLNGNIDMKNIKITSEIGIYEPVGGGYFTWLQLKKPKSKKEFSRGLVQLLEESMHTTSFKEKVKNALTKLFDEYQTNYNKYMKQCRALQSNLQSRLEK